jgi:pimeloyl-ACP methyl ester carboxylesterase
LTASNAIDPTTVTVIAAAKGIRTPDVGTEATLPDGRVLSYLDLGHPTGTPVMALDGPGSRALGRAAMPAAAELGVRVIVPDRPGFLGSTPQPDRAIVDWVADATTLADALGIDAFGLLGQSAGTPFALAVAARAPDRVLAVALCGAIVPLGDPGALDGVSGPMKPLFVLARRAPWALRPLLRLTSNPDKAADRALKDLAEKDRAAMDRPELLALHRETTAEIMRFPVAFAHEVRLVARQWGFDLADVQAPVGLWVGSEDRTHPPGMSARLAARLPHADEVHVVPGAATFGLIEAYPDALRFAVRR